jgi:hypothetical protein
MSGVPRPPLAGQVIIQIDSQYSHITNIRYLVLFTIFEQLRFPNCHIPDFQKLVENTRSIHVFRGQGYPQPAINT